MRHSLSLPSFSLIALLSLALAMSAGFPASVAGQHATREARSPSGAPLDPGAIRDTGLASLVRAERTFMEDVGRRRLNGWVDAFADSAATFPPGQLVSVGREHIRKGMAATFADTSVHVVWHPVYATLAASGDLGYTYGYYRWTSRDDKGLPAPPAEGKFLTIWRRDDAGRWRVVVDMGNAGPVPGGFFDSTSAAR
jgi:ketosteroid isomerase-like protein